MNSKTYAAMLEKKLTEEFKEKFLEKLGYYPIVVTEKASTDFNGNKLPILSLEALEECFESFLPTKHGRILTLKVKWRYREIVELRNIYCLLARAMGYNLKQIGRFLGKRDHTTVLHNIRTAKNLLENNSNFQELYKRVLENIKENYTYESSTLDVTNQVQHQPEPALLS